MTGIVYLTIYTGALVRHAKASLAYGGWPLPFHDIIHIQSKIGYNLRIVVWHL